MRKVGSGEDGRKRLEKKEVWVRKVGKEGGKDEKGWERRRDG